MCARMALQNPELSASHPSLIQWPCPLLCLCFPELINIYTCIPSVSHSIQIIVSDLHILSSNALNPTIIQATGTLSWSSIRALLVPHITTFLSVEFLFCRDHLIIDNLHITLVLLLLFPFIAFTLPRASHGCWQLSIFLAYHINLWTNPAGSSFQIYPEANHVPHFCHCMKAGALLLLLFSTNIAFKSRRVLVKICLDKSSGYPSRLRLHVTF